MFFTKASKENGPAGYCSHSRAAGPDPVAMLEWPTNGSGRPMRLDLCGLDLSGLDLRSALRRAEPVGFRHENPVARKLPPALIRQRSCKWGGIPDSGSAACTREASPAKGWASPSSTSHCWWTIRSTGIA